MMYYYDKVTVAQCFWINFIEVQNFTFPNLSVPISERLLSEHKPHFLQKKRMYRTGVFYTAHIVVFNCFSKFQTFCEQ